MCPSWSRSPRWRWWPWPTHWRRNLTAMEAKSASRATKETISTSFCKALQPAFKWTPPAMRYIPSRSYRIIHCYRLYLQINCMHLGVGGFSQWGQVLRRDRAADNEAQTGHRAGQGTAEGARHRPRHLQPRVRIHGRDHEAEHGGVHKVCRPGDLNISPPWDKTISVDVGGRAWVVMDGLWFLEGENCTIILLLARDWFEGCSTQNRCSCVYKIPYFSV